MSEIDQQNQSNLNTQTLNIELAAREPWPSNACLYVPLKEQMIIWAPNCLATLCLLRKANVPSLHIEYVRNAAEMSNYGIPPVLTINNRVFSEFEEIENLIQLKGMINTNFDENSITDSFSILCTEVLGTLMKYVLLSEKAGPSLYQSFISIYPWPLGLFLYLLYRKQTIKMLKAKEIWSLTYDQALHKFETTVRALSEKLQQNNTTYILGDTFTKADAHLYGHLCSILYMRIDEYENLRQILHKYKPLVDYVNNFEQDVRGLSLLIS